MKLIAWMWRRLARVVERHYECYLIRCVEWRAAIDSGHELMTFCSRSGYLRGSGAYSSAGRHAERKVRWRVDVLTGYLRNGAAGPWRT